MKHEDLSTRLIHHPYQAPEGFASPAVPVHHGSSVFFPSVAAMRARRWVDRSSYTYGLHGTPTTFTLEARIAELEGAQHVTLVPSGLAAITLVDMTFLRAGDVMLLPDNVYGPSKQLAWHELKQFGVETKVYDAMQPHTLDAHLGPDVALVWIEAPGSVTLEFPDLRALVARVRERAPKALVAIDNTWGAGVAFDAFDLGQGLGVDVSVHALTKYPSGGGDVLMGSVSCRQPALHERLSMAHARMGWGVGPEDCEKVLRGLPTLAMRYAHQDASTRKVAVWAQAQRVFARVLHPALDTSPGHAHWASLCKQAACLVTLECHAHQDLERVDAFVDALRRFRIGYSWAGPFSLAVPYQVHTMRQLGASPVRGPLVRLAMGLEAADDLIDDLERALPVLSR